MVTDKEKEELRNIAFRFFTLTERFNNLSKQNPAFLVDERYNDILKSFLLVQKLVERLIKSM